MVYNYHPRPCTQNLENSTELVLDCQTYAHKLKEDNKELAKQRGEQKEKRKIIAP